MLRLSGVTPDGQRVVIFVLEPDNVTRMRAGDPILVDIQRMVPDVISAPLLLRIECPEDFKAAVREYAEQGLEDGAKVNIIPRPAKGNH
jgi:hypothetical protein